MYSHTPIDKLKELIERSRRLAEGYRSLIDPNEPEESEQYCIKADFYDDVAHALEELYFDKL